MELLDKVTVEVRVEDDAIYDLVNTDEYYDNFKKEFLKTAVGKILIKSGFQIVDHDFDDNTFTLFFERE